MSESNVLEMPTPGVAPYLRLCACAEYAVTCIRQMDANRNPPHTSVKRLRNAITSLRNVARGYDGTATQAASLRIATLEILGEMQALDAGAVSIGPENIPHVVGALESLLVTLGTMPTPPAQSLRAA